MTRSLVATLAATLGIALLGIALLGIVTAPLAQPSALDPVTVHVFYDNVLHFTPDDSSRYDTPAVTASDRGRVITRTLDLGALPAPARITAQVTIRPIPKDDKDVHDRWDRAANVRLSRPDTPDIEIVKLITAYGGVTEQRVDVTHLAPLLSGRCTFRGFVDTWMSPGWKLDFSLLFEPVPESDAPAWIRGIFYRDDMTAERLAGGPLTVEVEIPDGLTSVVLHYLPSGHCTDGRGADEFETKDHVITVDRREVHRLRPWRDDCVRFRSINPYCRRWSDGSWSSDYPRSGWCPGDKVDPIPIDLTGALPPGRHRVGFHIEGVRPRDEEGNFGYWRVSAHLLGWRE